MTGNQLRFSIDGLPPLVQLIFSLLTILAGILLFHLILITGSRILDVPVDRMLAIPDPGVSETEIFSMRFVQVSQQLAVFLIPSLIIARLFRGNGSFLMSDRIPGLFSLFLIFILSLLVIPVTTYTGAVNSGLQLPDAFSAAEEWMRSKEKEAAEITSILMDRTGSGSFMLTLVIMALVPAVSEEFIFRGVLQQLLVRWIGSATAGIWITAILFSTIHFQFYGFLPRMLLGLVFGYLFLWTGSIWAPVLGHFVNNAAVVVMSFIPVWPALLKGEQQFNNPVTGFPYIPVILGGMILYYLWSASRKKAAQQGD